jgi:hypothetical protein
MCDSNNLQIKLDGSYIERLSSFRSSFLPNIEKDSAKCELRTLFIGYRIAMDSDKSGIFLRRR